MARSTLRALIGIAAILVAATATSRTALAQYMYLDTNGDGLGSAADVVSPTGVTTIDVWLRTNADRSGTPAVCNVGPSPLTISAYLVVLRPDGGTVLWGPVVNRMPFTIELGTGPNGKNDMQTGFGTSGAPLPPGLYRLTTFTLTPATGTPSIQIVPFTGIDNPLATTAFASNCFGTYFDATMRLGLDWFDADGAAWGAVPLAAAIDLDPDVINLKSYGRWLTAYIEPSGFDPASIDISSLRLAGSVPAVSKFGIIGDHNMNGVPDLVVKFSREALNPLLTLGLNELDLTGSLVSGEDFKGSDEIRVIDPGASLQASVAPNPLNPAGILSFRTVAPGPTMVRMFDLRGRLVRTLAEVDFLPAGAHEVRIDGRGERGQALASGIYFYRIDTAQGVMRGRVAILK